MINKKEFCYICWECRDIWWYNDLILDSEYRKFFKKDQNHCPSCGSKEWQKIVKEEFNEYGMYKM